MNGNQDVIKVLLSALVNEAQLTAQYYHDWRIVKFMGVNKTARKIHEYSSDSRKYGKKLADRILFLGGATTHDVGSVIDQPTLTAIFQNHLRLEMSLVQPYESAVKLAMTVLDDTTRNLFEHLLKWHEDHVAWIEKQLRMIVTLGGEAEYIAENL